MSTVNWPSLRAFGAANFRFGASTPKSSFVGFFDGQVQSISHLADRLRCTVSMPPCNAADGAEREAFFMGLASTGDWVRLGHLQRLEPRGTLRGTPTVASLAAAGARSLVVSTIPGVTLLSGDPIGASSGQMLLTAFGSHVANGSGLLTMPLVLPLRASLSAATALSWQAPTATFQLASDITEFGYGRRAWQQALELQFTEAY